MNRLSDRLDNQITKLKYEFQVFHPRLLLAMILMAPLPLYFGNSLRARILKMVGFNIGQNVVFWGSPTITGNKDIYNNLRIGRSAKINAGCFLDLGAPINIGENVAIGHEVLFMTTTHELGDPERRAGTPRFLPIKVGRGAWIGARATILPGITIGDGAVVGAGAVVTRDVPPNMIVGGIPAKIIRPINEEDGGPNPELFAQKEVEETYTPK